MKRKQTRTEAEICQRLAEVASRHGWIPYPETGGWDVLLVADRDRPGGRGRPPIDIGTQIGVEAKVRANIEVLDQATRRAEFRTGPEFVAILTQKASRSFRRVANRLRLNSWTLQNVARWNVGLDYRRTDRRPHRLPPIVPLGVGGLPCPRALTPWRVAAIRVALQLDDGAELTRGDIQAMGCDPRYFLEGGWLESTGRKRGRAELFRKSVTRSQSRRRRGTPWPLEGWETEAELLRTGTWTRT